MLQGQLVKLFLVLKYHGTTLKLGGLVETLLLMSGSWYVL